MTVSRSQPSNAAPHVPAAFINAIAEEGTKHEAIFYLQKQWNETCALKARVAELETELASCRACREKIDCLSRGER
jgi:hypothetical protein